MRFINASELLILGVALAPTSEHELVPIHELLNEEEAQKLLSELKVKLQNLPKILDTDPQSKKLGAKPGQIIKISRNDRGNKYTYYRLVVEE